MLWIGLTGCIGCGKSTVAQLLKSKYGVEVISADEVSHNVMLTSPIVHTEILQRWGLDPKQMDPEAYRKAIAAKVFGAPEELQFLERLMHPLIRDEVQKQRQALESKDHAIAFYDVPLLFEKNMEDQFDLIVGVFASEDVQRQRISARNTWSKEDIERRIQTQMKVEDKIKGCDHIIFNDSSLEDLEQQVENLYWQLS